MYGHVIISFIFEPKHSAICTHILLLFSFSRHVCSDEWECKKVSNVQQCWIFVYIRTTYSYMYRFHYEHFDGVNGEFAWILKSLSRPLDSRLHSRPEESWHTCEDISNRNQSHICINRKSGRRKTASASILNFEEKTTKSLCLLMCEKQSVEKALHFNDAPM